MAEVLPSFSIFSTNMEGIKPLATKNLGTDILRLPIYSKDIELERRTPCPPLPLTLSVTTLLLPLP